MISVDHAYSTRRSDNPMFHLSIVLVTITFCAKCKYIAGQPRIKQQISHDIYL